ncbi:MAG: SdpI family protein [Verrucomicrobia bacterium]|nr:SdpI family protein [Verrucomicrobiota bacterium]
MNLKSLKNEWLQILILAVPFCAVALLWDKLPDWMPIHWNARGEVDDYARKGFGAFLLPVTNVLITILMGLIPLIDPKLHKIDPDMRASLWRTVKFIRLLVSSFFLLVSLAVIGAALGLFGSGQQFSYTIYAGIGVLFIVFGNLMTKLRPNYFLGIRTPWTLESKEVWMKTHRMGGRLMVLGGFVMLALFLVVPLEQFVYWVLLPISGLLALVPMLYSYLLFRKQRTA